MKKLIEGVNDLKSTHPHLLTEIDYENNGGLDIDKLFTTSGKKVWWKCRNGHSWEARVYVRTKQQRGCPYCAGQRTITGVNDIATLRPDLATEWNYEKNGNLLPSMVMPGSGKKVWWKCRNGHEWQVSPNSRTSQNTNCPICSNELKTSFPEQAIFYYFQKYTKTYNRYLLEGVEVDIYLPEHKMAIEYDGEYYHRNKENAEEKKKQFCVARGINLIRIKELPKGERARNTDDIYWVSKTDYAELTEVIKILCGRCGMILNDDAINIYRDQGLIWSNYIKLEKEESLLKLYPEIAKWWDYEKNIKLSPEHVMPSSQKKVWWNCENGENHSYIASVFHRVHDTGCPYCSNQKVLKGYNDLVTKRPDLAKQWDYEKNGDDRPEQFVYRSIHKAWWICDKGHSYQATISKRFYGTKCPVCDGKKVVKGTNDLITMNQDIKLIWNYEKNENAPEDYALYSNKKVWWKCDLCGFEWESAINHISNGRGCPQCAKTKRIETTLRKRIETGKSKLLVQEYPEIAIQWDYLKNEGIDINLITTQSNRKVWWRCSCGYSWAATVANRVKHKGNLCQQCKRKMGELRD